jgi:hypothetical protein
VLGEVIFRRCVGTCEPLAHLHVSEILPEPGLFVDASCIWRWVQAYAPELDKRSRPHLKTTNKSSRVDETYLKVKGTDRYLDRAVPIQDSWPLPCDPASVSQFTSISSARLAYRRIAAAVAAGTPTGTLSPGASVAGSHF